MKKSSFLERLTGSITFNKYDEVLADDHEFSDENPQGDTEYEDESEWHGGGQNYDETPQEGELPVDMFHTGEEIVIRALVAGVSPDDMDIAITRDMVTIRGIREEVQETSNDNYFHRELFWGSFSRTLLLPEEVVIDEAEAHEKNGMLEIRLPKVDKDRSTKLAVKSRSLK
jgi:HSP20 family protein